MERIEEMPVRTVILKKVIDSSFDLPEIKNGIFTPGEILDFKEEQFEEFKSCHPESIQEIEMTEEDWLNLTISNIKEAKDRISKFEELTCFKYSSKYSIDIPNSYENLIEFYSNLKNAYAYSKLLKITSKAFEYDCILTMRGINMFNPFESELPSKKFL